MLHRQGPLGIPGGVEGIAFMNVDAPRVTNTIPNIEFMLVAGSIASDPSIRHGMGISNAMWQSYLAPLKDSYAWTIFPMLLQPKSRGEILLRDRKITSKPKIYANYLSHPEDVRVLIKGVRAVIELSKTNAMQRFGSKHYDKPVPGCEGYVYDSDEYWECVIRTFSTTIYHHSGTAKMGAKKDPTAVVDPWLRVSFCLYLKRRSVS